MGQAPICRIESFPRHTDVDRSQSHLLDIDTQSSTMLSLETGVFAGRVSRPVLTMAGFWTGLETHLTRKKISWFRFGSSVATG